MTGLDSRIAVIVVNYGTHELLSTSLARLSEGMPDAAVVVVDNHHSFRERAAIRELCATHSWTLVEQDANLGFGAGMNAGVRRAHRDGRDLTLLLNPDVQVEADVVRGLAEACASDERLVVSPRLVRGDGRDWFVGSRVEPASGHLVREPDPAAPGFWLSATCLMVSAPMWRRVGGFDDGYFMYWEDVDLSVRLRSAGAALQVLPALTAVHEQGGSQGSTKSTLYFYYNCRNRLLFAAWRLSRRETLQWIATTPRISARILFRGGYRQAVTRPATTWAAVRGTLAGLLVALVSLAWRPQPAAVPRARVYDSLRTAHLERFATMPSAEVLYHRTRYDYDAALEDAARPPVKVGRAAVLTRLMARDYARVEVNEPAMYRRWPDLLAATAAATVRARLTGRPAALVTYCIGVTDPAEDMRARYRLPRKVAVPVTRAVLGMLAAGTDRFAFGTAGSLQAYAPYLPPATISARSAVFEALPAPCDCPRTSDSDRARTVTFVGAFDDRKGIRQLMAAWDEVGRLEPKLRLLLIGKGKLLEQVQQWSSGRDDVELVVDPPRERIHTTLRNSAAVVLLSQRVNGWREQVGLPIVEGLAHGCRVVTTTETGLAPWLREHGHGTLGLGATAAETAAAIVSAVASGAEPDEVLATLPAADRRIEADEWLMADDSEPLAAPAAHAHPVARRTDVVVGFPGERGVDHWRERHATSPVPGRWPYGMEHLAGDGREVVAADLRPPSKSTTYWPRRRRASADSPEVALCWDEATALRMIAQIRAQRMYAGVIWATDQIAAGRESRVLTAQRRALRRYDGLWVLSRPQIERVESWLGPGCPPVSFLPFGIDVDFYRPVPMPARPRVVSVGGDRDRDAETLYAALALVLEARPDVECVVQSKADVTPPPGVQRIESLPHVQVHELLGDSTVVALATRPNWHASGMTVALEAMSVGRPVVACDTPGMDDYILTGETGELVPPRDPKAMSAAILELLDDRDVARAMGERGQAHVRASHTTQVMCAELNALTEPS